METLPSCAVTFPAPSPGCCLLNGPRGEQASKLRVRVRKCLLSVPSPRSPSHPIGTNRLTTFSCQEVSIRLSNLFRIHSLPSFLPYRVPTLPSTVVRPLLVSWFLKSGQFWVHQPQKAHACPSKAQPLGSGDLTEIGPPRQLHEAGWKAHQPSTQLGCAHAAPAHPLASGSAGWSPGQEVRKCMIPALPLRNGASTAPLP